MYIIDQHKKRIMEECKLRARDAGLKFDDETIEYIVTNKDMVDLSPKVMIPTLYDYWVNDVEVLKGHGKYKLYPNNPYETVINSRPAISFYNDNNPDWLNIMIFYHVLGHIDFFQNNSMFEHTWNDDFVGKALADKRLIASLRSEYGRWVDYAIEFSRNMDNLVGYFHKIANINFPKDISPTKKIEYYFDTFLQNEKKVPQHEYFKEVDRYNSIQKKSKNFNEGMFFSEIKIKYPEFHAMYERYVEQEIKEPSDVMEFVMQNSPFLNKESNSWMKSVLSIIRDTSMYFQPQIRTKIINEGWASYWHDKLFRADERIKGHEVAYAKLNAGVTSIRRIGLNPYAIGLRLVQHIENLADKGKISYDFQKLTNIEDRNNFDKKEGKGQEAIFNLRKNFSDFSLINTFVDQDFVDKYNLFVVGQRMNQQRGTVEYYIKSKKGEDYKQMLIDSLYHPPVLKVSKEKTTDNNLYLVHKFEGKQLIKDFIPSTIMGIEYMWGSQVQLETTEILVKQNQRTKQREVSLQKVLYTIKNKQVSKALLK